MTTQDYLKFLDLLIQYRGALPKHPVNGSEEHVMQRTTDAAIYDVITALSPTSNVLKNGH